MKYSGSITIKKIELLALIEDERIIFQSDISKDNKWFSFGAKSAYQRLLVDNNNTCYLLTQNWNYRLTGFAQFWDSLFKVNDPLEETTI